MQRYRLKAMSGVCVVIALMLLLSGCGFLRKAAIKVSQEDLENAATARLVAKNCLETWDMKSGFIRKALGTSIKKLPQEAVDALKELDTLAAKKDDELTDKEVGEFLALKIVFSGSLVKKALKKFAPEIFKLIPVLF